MWTLESSTCTLSLSTVLLNIYLFISYYLRSRFLIYNLGAVHRMVDSVRGIRTP